MGSLGMRLCVWIIRENNSNFGTSSKLDFEARGEKQLSKSRVMSVCNLWDHLPRRLLKVIMSKGLVACNTSRWGLHKEPRKSYSLSAWLKAFGARFTRSHSLKLLYLISNTHKVRPWNQRAPLYFPTFFPHLCFSDLCLCGVFRCPHYYLRLIHRFH